MFMIFSTFKLFTLIYFGEVLKAGTRVGDKKRGDERMPEWHMGGTWEAGQVWEAGQGHL